MPTDARLRIRPATAADLGAIAEIERAVFSDPWPAGAFGPLLGPFAWVAADASGGGGLAGYVFAHHALEEGEILNLAVPPAYRRSGVGRALMEHVVGELAHVGVARVYLEVRESNQAGRAFYAALGFRPVGKRRGYYARPREDALVLVREIGASRGLA
jgi:[ribosomal protein S18]-alanine N-acetyltransferase